MVDDRRRGFLRCMAALPVVGSFVSPAAAVQSQQMANAAISTVGLTVGGLPASDDNVWGHSIARKVGQPFSLWRLLRRQFHKDEEEFRHKFFFREGPFEANIAACRSWSHGFRASVQHGRDTSRSHALTDRRLGIYGDD